MLDSMFILARIQIVTRQLNKNLIGSYLYSIYIIINPLVDSFPLLLLSNSSFEAGGPFKQVYLSYLAPLLNSSYKQLKKGF